MNNLFMNGKTHMTKFNFLKIFHIPVKIDEMIAKGKENLTSPTFEM